MVLDAATKTYSSDVKRTCDRKITFPALEVRIMRTVIHVCVCLLAYSIVILVQKRVNKVYA